MKGQRGQSHQRMASENRHTCHCGKGFLRKEHLRRHQATHAEPSFVCHICDRSFTRNDVLKRHVAVHDATQATSARTWRACDACHENKTKCDGGDRCGLCAKRGIHCTYKRDGATGEGPVDGKEKKGDNEVAATLPNDCSSHVAELLPEDMVMEPPTPVEDGQSTSSHSAEDDIEVARRGLECISNAATTAMAGKKRTASSEATSAWIEKCKRTYFGGFHERWPIVQAPIFDLKTDDTLFVASVLMIGSWLSDDSRVRDLIFKMHGYFMFYLSRKMVADDAGPNQPWRFELYQIIMLHLTFAFESGRSSLVTGARRLLALLVTALRSNGSLNTDMIERHESAHHPGTFRPWLFGHRMRWRKLAVSILKLDTYMALLSNQPPLLQTEELELQLPSTFALWNALGINVFFKRDPQEPEWREQSIMADFIGGSAAPSSSLLPDDVALGFCGAYRDIWKWSRVSRTGNTQSADADAVHKLVESWKSRLDDMANLWTEPQVKEHEINLLLRAYRGEEDDRDPGREKSVLTRLCSICLNTTMLYHLLAINLSAETRCLNTIVLGSWSLEGRPAATLSPSDRTRLDQWALEPRARNSVIHSLCVLKAYENTLTIENLSHTVDPIANVALCTAAIVMKAWLWASSSCCCSLEGMKSLEINDTSAKDHWVRLGGPVLVDNVALCGCSKGPWMARFVSALMQGGQQWEMSGSIAECLRSP